MMLLRIIILIMIYSIACFGAGSGFIRIARLQYFQKDKNANILSAVSTAFLLGMLILGCLWMLLGLSGTFSPLIIWFVVGLSLVLGIYELLTEYGSEIIHSLSDAFKDFMEDRISWKVIKVTSIFYIFSFLSTIGSELAADAAYFYMTMPKVLANSHLLRPIPGKAWYETFGFVGEMHQAALITMGSDDAARLFSWIVLLAAIFLLAGIVRLTGIGQHGQWISNIMLLTSSGVIWFFGEGKVDIYAVAFAFGSIYWVLEGKYPFITGLFFGYAILAKNTYFAALLPILGVIVLWKQIYNQKESDRKSLFYGFVFYCIYFSLGVFVPIIPHLIKNFIYYRDLLPISDTATVGFFNWTGWDNTPYTKRIYLTFPVDITFNIRGISPLVICFLPLILFKIRQLKWKRDPLIITTIAAAIGTLSMFIVFPAMLFEVRFYLPALLMFIPAAAAGAEYASSNSSFSSLINRSVIIATLSIIIWSFLWSSTDNVPIFEFKQTFQYLSGNKQVCEKKGEFGVLQPRCNAMIFLDHKAELGARVLTNSFHTYWLRSDLLQCANKEYYQDDPSIGNVEKAWQAIREQGYHYLIYDTGYPNHLKALNIDSKLPADVILNLIYDNNIIKVYDIDFEKSEGKESLFSCQRTTPTIWEVVRK